MATGRLRRTASRMSLSPNVAKSSIKPKRSGRDNAGPFAGMNQTEARIRGAPRPRSSAALKRTGDSEESSTKSDSPLYKALKMQTTLAPVSYGRRTAIKNKLAEITSFDQFPLLPVVRNSILSQALPGIVDAVPTPIQRLAIPRLLQDAPARKKSTKIDEDDPQYDQFLLAAETGSGKTLAYLIPLVDAIKRQEAEDKILERRQEEEKAREAEERMKEKALDIEPEMPPLSNAGRPRVVILVPTAELVAQVGVKVKAFAHTHSFQPGGIDILVTTPHLLASIAKTEPYVLSRVSHLVLDEADSLMDRSFLPTTSEVISKAAPSLQKLILCSATIPRSLDNQLRKRYPDIVRLTTPNLHAIPRRVQLGVVDIQKDPYRGNRNLACADVIWSIGKAGDTEPSGPFAAYEEPKVKKILVFVNEREEAEEVAKEERRLPNTKVLVTTDIASRGIDTLAVKTVVLYHVPHTTIDFIHRLGRLGRMGKRGRAIVLVGKKDRKDVVKEVREGMFRGQALI
ncbi:hypothetical protein ARAM_003798 [Aspergillus rambellii]|uniref:RNA helicase n=1 Tax=Aspergillus rambellii TaxID=308745 RepID=A0A0F8TX09_9EURO|nr:hypothetical protein ARAM_003798 [Aspergillus rambellii]